MQLPGHRETPVGRRAPFRTARASRARSQRGASAVEFALVSVVFFPLMLGIVDYGLWFNDSLNARQGTREAARMAVVQEFGSCSGAALDKVACVTKKEIAAVAGTTTVKVKAPSGWAKGNPLLVCAAVKVTGVTGITPLPSSGVIPTKTQMSIEVDLPATGVAATGGESAPVTDPTGKGWAWCA
jgi:Flp pilus assembly protein TadG